MEGVLKVDSGFDFLFSRLDDVFLFVFGICAVLLGIFLGHRNKQIICRELQPIIHNIHNLYPILKKDNEVKEEDEVKEEEVKEEEVKEEKEDKEEEKEIKKE
jgi:hypothetical protein